MGSPNGAGDLDFTELARILKRGYRWVLGGVAFGVLLGALVYVITSPQYEGATSLVIRDSPQPGANGLGALGVLLPIQSGLTTELHILESRSLAEGVVDSLGLQLEFDAPGLGVGSALTLIRAQADVEEGDYSAERLGDVVTVRGPAGSAQVRIGQPFELGGVVARVDRLSQGESIEFRLLDRGHAVRRLQRNLKVDNPGGDIAKVEFRSADRNLAAAVPNTLVNQYLRRRRTTDRGVNQRRYEFLVQRIDSLASELSIAEAALRGYQERSGSVDPSTETAGSLTRYGALQAEAEAAEVEARALRGVLRQISDGRGSTRQLAAYPTFLQNAAINDLLSRLLQLESERTRLLQRRRESDPEVSVLDRSISELEEQLRALATAYLAGLDLQRVEIARELDEYQNNLAAVPAHALTVGRLQREVVRLSESLLALQGQLVQARVAAVSEGGDIRQIDPAIVPRDPVFPTLPLTLGLGMLGGMVLGIGSALVRGYLGERIDDPDMIRTASGVPVTTLHGRSPLFISSLGHRSVVLVVPLGQGARPKDVAQRIAETVGARDERVMVVEMHALDVVSEPELRTRDRGVGHDTTVPVRHVNGRARTLRERVLVLEDLRREASTLVVAIDDELASTAPALVPREASTVVFTGVAGRFSRSQLRTAIDGYAALGLHIEGIVVTDGDDQS